MIKKYCEIKAVPGDLLSLVDLLPIIMRYLKQDKVYIKRAWGDSILEYIFLNNKSELKIMRNNIEVRFDLNYNDLIYIPICSSQSGILFELNKNNIIHQLVPSFSVDKQIKISSQDNSIITTLEDQQKPTEQKEDKPYSAESFVNQLIKDELHKVIRGSNIEDLVGRGIQNIASPIIENKVQEIINVIGIKDRIEKDVSEAINNSIRKEIAIDLVVNNKEVGVVHGQFEEVLKLISTKEPLFLYGPAGSGKTSIAIKVAIALDLSYQTLSVNEQTTESKFLGYYDINSKLIRTPFREIYENGGVFIIDEIDAGNPNVLTVLNSALSNGEMAFPDGQVKKHNNFICVCTANTDGRKGSSLYIGRNVLDAATLDRFIKLEISYCEKLENKILSTKTLKIRKQIRKHIIENNLNTFLSTRSLKQIDALLTKGYNSKEAVKIACSFNEDILSVIK